MKRFQNPETIHPPLGAYSHLIEVSEPKRWLVLSGQIGMREDGSLPDDPLEQFKVALDNIHKNLKAAGMEIQDLVKLTYYLAGEIDTAKRREASAVWLGDHRPCSTLLYVAALATPEIKVEIDAWACE
ncbi:MAG: RidA family protein [Anaerolineales bacterium]|nr:RidA family protein [Anaerolineales bacterium]